MDSARWLRVRAILESALDRSPEDRGPYLSVACDQDPELRAEVLSLISAHESGQYLESGPPLPRDLWCGRRIGPWLLGRCVGYGGMGTVYEARRFDHEYEKRVAVKLVNATAGNGESVRRFLNERQLLAQLEHPSIAQMLDGGTTSDGVPYLVLEYVEGVSIDRFCFDRQLPIREILVLFRAVCAAVEHAHRNLVVHRDIKPGNILVTSDGTPKLLDFGIAKLVNPGATTTLTRTAQRPMTPAYASPEQVKGAHITTASDVYSLGVLLYRLLSGALPFGDHAPGLELERAIIEEDPAIPSAVHGLPPRIAKALRGDLDAIVTTAMRREPVQRYPSVESLSEDIARHLMGLPVRARPHTVAYRAVRFVRRHRAWVTAGAAVALCLMGATAVSLVFAHRASVSSAAAEARFNELHSLAGFFLFEFDDAVRAGSTAARRSVVERGLAYLDRLAQTKTDGSMAGEVIAGYCRAGDLQGNMFYPNLGDGKSSAASYQRANQLLQRLKRSDPGSPATRKTVALVEQKLGELAVSAGKRPEAFDRFQRALELLEPLARSDRSAQRSLAEIHSRRGFTHYQNAHFAAALEDYQQARQLVDALLRGTTADMQLSLLAAGCEQRSGELLARTGLLKPGLARLRRALAEFESLMREHPDDGSIARGVVTTHVLLGSLLAEGHRYYLAIPEYQEATKQAERLIGTDPQNVQYRRDDSVALSLLASALYDSGRKLEGRAITVQALAAMQGAADSGGATEYDLHEYCRALVETRYRELRNPAEARRYAERVVQMTNGGNARILDLLARAFEQMGDLRQATAIEAKALAMLPPAESGALRQMEENLERFSGETMAKPPATRQPRPPVGQSPALERAGRW